MNEARQRERKSLALPSAKETNRLLGNRPPNRIFLQLLPPLDSQSQYLTCQVWPKLPAKIRRKMTLAVHQLQLRLWFVNCMCSSNVLQNDFQILPMCTWNRIESNSTTFTIYTTIWIVRCTYILWVLSYPNHTFYRKYYFYEFVAIVLPDKVEIV